MARATPWYQFCVPMMMVAASAMMAVADEQPRAAAAPPPGAADAAAADAANGNDVFLDDLPDSVISSMELRERELAGLPVPDGAGEEFLIEYILRWNPGQTVRVAFLGGSAALHEEIADATKQITDNCNLKLDFRFNPANGTYRSWSTSDAAYKAEIRVSFDQQGFFSLVGTDSTNLSIGSPTGPVGGRPNQRSLNLGGFHVHKPANWRGVVRHEFLHALAFHHEHQSPASPCEEEFRWENDPGYVLTQDPQGRYITDPNGKRPGIYTYLAGYPNFWPRAKVDHNLRRYTSGTGLGFGSFDRRSVMLYRFPPLFYRNASSPCVPLGTGEDLSQADIQGLAQIYPSDMEAIEQIVSGKERAINATIGLESVGESVKGGLREQRKLYERNR